MKKNQKGFTIVELVLSFALISVIVIGMLTIVINYRSMVKISNRKIELVQYKSTLTKAIQDDIIELGISNIKYCSDASGNDIAICVTITFKDETTKNLSYANSNVQNRYIQYGSQKFPIQEAGQDDFTSLSDAMIHLPSERTGISLSSIEASDKIIFKVRIPIVADDIDEDFGLFLVASNGDDNFIDTTPSIVSGPVKDVVFADENLKESCITYDDGVDTFLAGQCSNNYVWYSGKLWRVVLKNNSTGAVKLVTDNAITIMPANETDNIVFENSYIDQWLQQEFLPTLHDASSYLVTDYLWDATLDTSTTPTRPNGTTSVGRTVGLLNAYEYYTTYEKSGGLATYQTTYLNNKLYWWTLTPYSQSHIHRIINDGSLLYTTTYASSGVRPAINLKSTVEIEYGSGTEADPYILKGDIKDAIGGVTLLNTRYSGEYIMFNNELYRIVNVENGLTKITAVEKPVSLANNPFHSTTGVSNFKNASIKTDLENYYQTLATTNVDAYNMIEANTTWYLGQVSQGDNYKASICKTVDASISASNCERIDDESLIVKTSIALPRAGEMFTSQITRGSKYYFWTLTPWSEYVVRRVNTIGYFGDMETSDPYGARPSMYLKSTVKIASNNIGNGTYDNPYSLSVQ